MAWAELTDVRCHYELRGRGEPLLLIAGLGNSLSSWGPILPRFSPSFSLIFLDNRGIGLSEALRPPLTLRDFVSDIVELLDKLQTERCHILGISFGGMIAHQLALDHPGRVDRLVLVSCADAFSAYLKQVAMVIAHALRKFSGEMYARTLELLGTSPQFLDAHADEVERRIIERLEQNVARTAIAQQLRCISSCMADVDRGVVTRPTLVVAGERDMLIPSCYARQMAEKIEGSEFFLVPEAGHNPLTETPEKVLPRIVEFLNRGRTGVGFPAIQFEDQHIGADPLLVGGI